MLRKSDYAAARLIRPTLNGRARNGRARNGRARNGRARNERARNERARNERARNGRVRNGRVRNERVRNAWARLPGRTESNGLSASGRGGSAASRRPGRGRTWRTANGRSTRLAWRLSGRVSARGANGRGPAQARVVPDRRRLSARGAAGALLGHGGHRAAAGHRSGLDGRRADGGLARAVLERGRAAPAGLAAGRKAPWQMHFVGWQRLPAENAAALGRLQCRHTRRTVRRLRVTPIVRR